MYRLALPLLLFIPSAALAQELEPEVTILHVPPAGSSQTVSVGTQIHEYSRLYSFNATITDQKLRGGQWLIPIEVEAGTPLYPVSTNSKFKACARSGACGLDDDGDGKFDRMAKDSASLAIKLKQPVAYRTTRITVENPLSLKQVILYAGATSDTLRLSYREFSNDMARPAFTEELTIPIGKSFPQDVAVKAIKFRIHSINGLGMTYEILP